MKIEVPRPWKIDGGPPNVKNETVLLDLPDEWEVFNDIYRQMQALQLENLIPTTAIVGVRAWYAIRNAETVLGMKVIPDASGVQDGVRLLCSPEDEWKRYCLMEDGKDV